MHLLIGGIYHIVNLWKELVCLAAISKLTHYLDLSNNFHTVVLTLGKVGYQLDGDLPLGKQTLGQHDISK
jgi:hypothetical protein